jgi:hypothetical protein
MPGSRSMRLVECALRCYPRRWRSRHGEEAAEIACLLIRDGAPARSVAWSYLMGATRTRLVVGPRRRLGAAAAALVLAAGSVAVPLALLSASAPANAASVAHSRTAHPRPAHPRPADLRPVDLRPVDLRHAGSRPADPRYWGGRGAPHRCDRHDHC